MPTVTTPTVDVSWVLQARTPAEHAVARIAAPTKTGQTIYKIGATWHIGRTIAQSTLDTASTVLLGGHVYDLPAETIEEIETALSVTLPVVA